MSEAATNTEQGNVAQLPAVRKQEIRVVSDAVPILDTARFEHMQRIAMVMARCSLVPDTLRKSDDYKTTEANCFLVVNQAVRWGMDPFAVAQCASVIHGKLCYEGKLVAAVMQKNGVNLEFELNGKQGDNLGVTVKGTLPGETKPRVVSGTVGQWKTANEQWKKDPAAMLCYRGARAWSRIHNPAPMLGVYTPDELEEIGEDARAARARDVSPPSPPSPPPAPAAETRPEAGGGVIMWDDATEDGPAPAPPPVPQRDASDPGPLPGFLDRNGEPAKPKNAAEEIDGWLEELKNAFEACESLDDLSKEQVERMTPRYGKVPMSAWTQAERLLKANIDRIDDPIPTT